MGTGKKRGVSCGDKACRRGCTICLIFFFCQTPSGGGGGQSVTYYFFLENRWVTTGSVVSSSKPGRGAVCPPWTVRLSEALAHRQPRPSLSRVGERGCDPVTQEAGAGKQQFPGIRIWGVDGSTHRQRRTALPLLAPPLSLIGVVRGPIGPPPYLVGLGGESIPQASFSENQ